MPSDDSAVGDRKDTPRHDDTLNLGRGYHSPHVLVDVKPLIASSTAHALEQESTECPNLNYACSLGCARYRTSLADFLSRHYDRKVHSEDLVLTAGATHGLHLIVTQFFNTGSLVFLEEPTYFEALDLLRRDLRMNIVPIDMEEDGINIDLLEARVSEQRADVDFSPSETQPFWALVYVIPDHHNPTGASLSPEKRRRLVSLAHRYDLLVLCDDVYSMLTYTGDLPRLLASCDSPADPEYSGGHVISNGSFSKICAPGLRVGWLEAPQRVVSVLAESRILTSGGAVNGYMSTVMASMMQLSLLDGHLHNLHTLLKDKMAAARARLTSDLPADRYHLSPAAGGFFLWLRCPFDTAGFVAWCESSAAGVTALPGSVCSCLPDGCRRYLRLSVSYLDSEQLQEAITRLCTALRRYESQQQQQ